MIQASAADPLLAQPRAERPAYATGMLLGADDFSDEQTYHRGRLARALQYLAGGGTLAGLAVQYVAPAAGQNEEIRVLPGLAVDRLGRLIEITRPACLRLRSWWDASTAGQPDALTSAAHTNLARFISTRLTEAAPVLPTRAVVADVFVRFAACEMGLTPSFASGPFDALNAVSTSRLRDAYELLLVARPGLDDAYSGLPLAPAAAALGNPAASSAARRNAIQDAVLAAYGSGSGALPAAPEQPDPLDSSSVFLARVFIPVDPGNPPLRTAQDVLVDSYARRFLPASPLFAQFAGL